MVFGLRLTGVVLATALLTACANTEGGVTPVTDEPSAPGGSTPDGTPAVTDSPARGEDAAAEDQASAAASPSQPVAGSNAPAGYVELRGDGDSFHAAMTEGDGSAEPMLLTDPPLDEQWQVVEADGPKFVQTICGVQMDPVEPRDAAHRRWGWVENFTYLTSEVHLFDEADAHGLAEEAGRALSGCEGFGVSDDGLEVPQGDGRYEVTVDPLPGLPSGWVGWTETTEAEGDTPELIRHNALRDVEGGWHWVSVSGALGEDPGPTILVDALESADR
ncbi:hypothetical protein [Ornithinimicrobium panacihumi]|uniref:hypothetical protein n=1 Tax=Ornithinimicrobium panacihumi TaxID=2008449 RepID=UPI003F89AFCC